MRDDRSFLVAVIPAILGLLLLWVPIPVTVELPASAMHADRGQSWFIEVPPALKGLVKLAGDTGELPSRSDGVLLEDGRPLGPAHTTHEDIRAKGAGRFSHWHGGLYFSSSDGSSPRDNGRRYALRVSGLMVPAIPIAFLILGAALIARPLWRSGALRRLWPLALAAFPVIAVALVVLGAVYGIHRGQILVRPASPEHVIVEHQLRRLREMTQFDLAFVGDSSCLMGVNPSQLSRDLGLARVENLCTLGYVGPAGYAAMVDRLSARGTPSQSAIVVMIHGIQLERDPGWDAWATIVREDRHRLGDPAPPLAAARFALWDALQPWVFSVLPGTYARHYASERSLGKAVDDGSVVDPSDRGIDVRAILPPFSAGRDEIARAQPPANAPASIPNAYRYRRNAGFDAAVPALREAVARSRVPVFLLVAPVPSNLEDAVTRTERAALVESLSRDAGIAPERVLDTPGALSPDLFVSSSHLSPKGKAVFSAIVAEALRKARGGQSAGLVPVTDQL